MPAEDLARTYVAALDAVDDAVAVRDRAQAQADTAQAEADAARGELLALDVRAARRLVVGKRLVTLTQDTVDVQAVERVEKR